MPSSIDSSYSCWSENGHILRSNAFQILEEEGLARAVLPGNVEVLVCCLGDQLLAFYLFVFKFFAVLEVPGVFFFSFHVVDGGF